MAKSAKCLFANPALTGPKTVMKELEQNFLDGFLEISGLASREPSPVPLSTPKTLNKRIALRNVDTNVEREANQSKRSTDKQTKRRGVVLDRAEFDEDQKTERGGDLQGTQANCPYCKNGETSVYCNDSITTPPPHMYIKATNSVLPCT